MSVLRPFVTSDMFTFSNVNLDLFTTTYSPSYYLNYLARWPDLCCATVAPNGRMMGYICGKAEGLSHSFHGHITILTVSPPCRLLRLASTLIAHLKAYYKNLRGGRGRHEEDVFGESCFDELVMFLRSGWRSVRANGRDVLVSREEVS
ncbi:hypothetical protein DFH07DRAFT_900358 [Mycena maculata]|uniref:N-acetyltransferase domain-containing protein n=1 Tax=Mycena maculata TaxID=230809 RepID=A0AAD7KK11_9AGAR|nr:hypothetical protein DFH07DRAFT_900358 [Mycena maculata]